jgi:iron complex outermembrane recepter protein
MGYRIRPLTAALAVVFSAPVAYAQSTLNEVVVNASRIPEATSPRQIGAAEIAAKHAVTRDTAALLQDVPGVSLYGAGGVSSLPSIHGLADDRLRITIDGMDFIATCPNHMNPPLSYLDPSAVSKIKVYAGITPVSVGGDICHARPGSADQGRNWQLLSQQQQRRRRQHRRHSSH